MVNMTRQMLLLLNIKYKLEKMGLTVSSCSEKGYSFDISREGEVLGKITDTCNFFTNHEQYKKNSEVLKIHQAIKNVRAGINDYFLAHNSMITGSYPNESKQLAEIGNVVVVGTLKENNELEYGVYRYSEDHKALLEEILTTDYAMSKSELLLRTNTKDLSFSEEEMIIIRDILSVAGSMLYEPGDNKQVDVARLLDKIQAVIGEIEDAPSKPRQQEKRKEEIQKSREAEEEL